MNNNTFETAEQAMNERQRIAADIYDEFMEKQVRTEFEDMLIDPCLEEITQLARRNATEFELDNAADRLMANSKMAGFIYGYTYAIERLRETLLLKRIKKNKDIVLILSLQCVIINMKGCVYLWHKH